MFELQVVCCVGTVQWGMQKLTDAGEGFSFLSEQTTYKHKHKFECKKLEFTQSWIGFRREGERWDQQ